MILCMPTIGQKVRVLDGQTWKFKLYQERRNYGAMEYFTGAEPAISTFYDDFVGGEGGWRATWGQPNRVEPERKHIPAELPECTVLTIDRIYLRKGAGDFDSVTFIVNNAKIPGKKGVHARVRFWVRLEDVNCGLLEMLWP